MYYYLYYLFFIYYNYFFYNNNIIIYLIINLIINLNKSFFFNKILIKSFFDKNHFNFDFIDIINMNLFHKIFY